MATRFVFDSDSIRFEFDSIRLSSIYIQVFIYIYIHRCFLWFIFSSLSVHSVEKIVAVCVNASIRDRILESRTECDDRAFVFV